MHVRGPAARAHTNAHAAAAVARAPTQALERTAAQKRWARTLHTPKTDSSIFIPYEPQQAALVRGRLADAPAKAGQPLRGVLVRQAGRDQLLHPDELAAFTKMTAGDAGGCGGGWRAADDEGEEQHGGLQELVHAGRSTLLTCCCAAAAAGTRCRQGAAPAGRGHRPAIL